VAEETGDLARAEQAYRAALKAYSEAGSGEEFRKNHPVSDPSGSRYRVALARVLLEEARGGQRMPAAPAGGDPKATRGNGTATPVVAVQSPLTRLVSWNSAQGLYCTPLLMMETAVTGGELGLLDQDAGTRTEDPRLDEALQLAQQAIDNGDNRGYLLKGEALAKKGQWTSGLKTYVDGLRRLCPEYAEGLAWLVDSHPAFQRPDTARTPDPEKGEQLYARGLLLFHAGRLPEAEQYFLDSLRIGEPDARVNYFLGLARLEQGKREQAEEDFRAAVRLERLNKPSPATVSKSLERIQGWERRRLNAFRQQTSSSGE
jgi:tetratricopeptide (TPR) repeat protein